MSDNVRMVLKFENIGPETIDIVYQDKESEEHMHPQMKNFVDDLYKPKDPFDVNKRLKIGKLSFCESSGRIGYLDKYGRLMINYLIPGQGVNPRNDKPVWVLWYENSVHFLWPYNPVIGCVMAFDLYPINYDIVYPGNFLKHYRLGG
jgi:hypothetical protein